MKNNIERKREKYLDIIKGIAILMIINVHLPEGTSVFKGITYHITSFFMVAGILMCKKEEEKLSYKEFIIKKLKAIMWPYFTLSLIYIIIKTIIDVKIPTGEIYISANLIGIGTLWFLPTLFLGEVLIIPVLKKFRDKNKIIIPITLILSLICAYVLNKNQIVGAPHIDKENIILSIAINTTIVIVQSIIAACYVGLGYIIQQVINKTNCMKYSRKIYLIIGIILLIINYFISFKISANLHYAEIYTPIYYFIGTIFGTLAIFNISYGIESIKFLEGPLGWLGRNSIILMTTHVEYKIVYYAYGIVQLLNLNNKIVIGILELIVVLIIEIVIVNIVNNTKLKVIYKFPQLRRHKNEK